MSFVDCRMAASDEQIELLVSTDTGGHKCNNSASSHASMHHAHNLTDFDVKYGRTSDVTGTSCSDTFLSCGREMTCKRDKVFNFMKRHVPVVDVIRTYKVCDRLVADLHILRCLLSLSL